MREDEYFHSVIVTKLEKSGNGVVTICIYHSGEDSSSDLQTIDKSKIPK